MDTRVSDLFGTGSAFKPGAAPGTGSASNNAAAVAPKKALTKIGKKAKSRSVRYPKSSNNPPYLPPEVSRASFLPYIIIISFGQLK